MTSIFQIIGAVAGAIVGWAIVWYFAGGWLLPLIGALFFGSLVAALGRKIG